MGITQPVEEYFKDGQWGWDGTRWRKLALLWGYTDRWSEYLGGSKSGDGTWVQSSTVVPAGYVYQVQFIAIANNNRDPAFIRIAYYDGANYYFVAYDSSPARYVPLVVTVPGVLKAGDRVRVTVSGCLDGDVLQGGVWGYKMAVT